MNYSRTTHTLRSDPRARGGHQWIADVRYSLGRAIPRIREHVTDACAAIPAHARITDRRRRSCGARAERLPRRRGETQAPVQVVLETRRAIPACAGSTCTSSLITGTAVERFPRAREHVLFAVAGCRLYERSPHTRGALETLHYGLVGGRAIPAHAGSTGSGTARDGDVLSDPRARGEH